MLAKETEKEQATQLIICKEGIRGLPKSPKSKLLTERTQNKTSMKWKKLNANQHQPKYDGS
jgi:hypothetical protein